MLTEKHPNMRDSQSYAPNNVYSDVREATDAHVEPGERNSGGTPE